MSAVRVYDLAKELNVSNNDLLEMLKGMGESAKTASSTIRAEAAMAIRDRVQSPASGNGKAAASTNGVSGVSANGSTGGSATPTASVSVSQTAPPASAPPAPAPHSAPQPQAPSASASAASPPAPSPTLAANPDSKTPAASGNSGVDTPAVKNVNIPDVVSLKDFADLIGVPAPNIQKKLMGLGVLASLNQKLSPEVTTRLAKSYGVTVNIIGAAAAKTPESPAGAVAVAATPTAAPRVAVVPPKPRQKPAGPVSRPPVVTIMGHVDHGKTTLLDAIRKAKVADSEFGGITQHIGAYQVEIDDPTSPGQKRRITFLDTPGHEAFTAMRARGAQVTDMAILVVAADDGIMPQTIEAIEHARAAQVPIIVAVNKIDKEGANPTRVLTQLTEHGLMPEAYGGDVQTVEVSAKEDLGIDDLLERIILVSDAEVDPKADPSAPATAVVIEAELDRGRGAIATILVDQGTVKMGDAVVAGASYGRIKAMVDDLGQRVQSAGPATPVVILGLNFAPNAGDRLEVVKNERVARQIAEDRSDDIRTDRLASRRMVTLEDLQHQIKQGAVKELNLIIKGDVQGSVEAIRQSLEKIEHPEVKVRFISSGVGAVGDSDVLLASASSAIILAFNTRIDPPSVRVAEAEHVDIREYKIIYDLIDDVKKAMAGLLEPIYEEQPLGKAEVRAVFKLPRSGGVVAGSYILEGKVVRNSNARVLRGGKVVLEGKIDSVKREKDDVREVAQGYECGIFIPGYDPQELDIIDCYEMRRIERSL